MASLDGWHAGESYVDLYGGGKVIHRLHTATPMKYELAKAVCAILNVASLVPKPIPEPETAKNIYLVRAKRTLIYGTEVEAPNQEQAEAEAMDEITAAIKKHLEGEIDDLICHEGDVILLDVELVEKN